MNHLRQLIAWLLLALVAVVGAGAAALGVSQAPNNVPLLQAVVNTQRASNYSEVVAETTPQGTQSDYLVYQAPDKLGGYIQSGSRRTYVYVIGSKEYQSITVTANTPTKHLVFYEQPSQGAATLDPAHNYLAYAQRGKNVQQSGSTYTFSLTEGGQVGNFVYTVSGKYVSAMTLTVKTASVQLAISMVGTSPPVALPAGAKVVAAPTTPGTPGTPTG
jgi:hypothetical protein